jgi:peptidoglycan-N-acetylglucosamine deacetylase
LHLMHRSLLLFALLVTLLLAACGSPAAKSQRVSGQVRPTRAMGLAPSSGPSPGARAARSSEGTSAQEQTSVADNPPDQPANPAALLDIVPLGPTVATIPVWGTRFTTPVDGISTHRRVVALTFDDGPTPRTRKIVRELDSFDDHATFFWVGSRITTDAARYSLKHGEELANHTWDHPNMHGLSSAEASAELGLTNARIAEFTGSPPTWFRSPFNRLYSAEFQQVRAHGLLYANYDVTSVDWMKGVTEAEVLAEVDGTLRPGGILLMHDSPKNPPRFLPAVLRLLKRRGYEVVTLTDLAQMGPPVTSPLRLGMKGLRH